MHNMQGNFPCFWHLSISRDHQLRFWHEFMSLSFCEKTREMTLVKFTIFSAILGQFSPSTPDQNWVVARLEPTLGKVYWVFLESLDLDLIVQVEKWAGDGPGFELQLSKVGPNLAKNGQKFKNEFYAIFLGIWWALYACN